MTPHERIRKTCSMSRRVRKMAFKAIRRCHPELDESEVQLLFMELTYGRRLANGVRRWLFDYSDWTEHTSNQGVRRVNCP